MTTDDVLAEFRAADALLEGHFILSSGLPSPIFLQKALVFMDPPRTERLCRALAQAITARFGAVDLVVSPAIGGIIPGYETARALGCRSIYVERQDGELRIRRNFSIRPEDRVVVVDDILSTGLSLGETIAALAPHGGHLLGVGCLIDRSGGRVDLGVSLVALATLDVPAALASQSPQRLSTRRRARSHSYAIRSFAHDSQTDP